MAALLPDIDVFIDSPFNDDPPPRYLVRLAKERQGHGQELKRGKRRIRFVDLPVSATRIVSSARLILKKLSKRVSAILNRASWLRPTAGCSMLTRLTC